MSALIPLFVAAPTVTGIVGYVGGGLRGAVLGRTNGALAAPPPGTPAHRPWVENFDLAGLTISDPRGFVHQVECYRVESWGLYLARIVDGPNRHYLESWLLPEPAIRLTITHSRPGHHRDRDYHLAIGEYGCTGPKCWRAVDHYLEIAVRHGRSAQLHGLDGLLAAHGAGLIDSEQAQRAVDRATTVLRELAAHEHDVEDWLAARGITVSWM